MGANLEISTRIFCRMACSYCPQASHLENYTKKITDKSKFELTIEDFIKFLSTVPTSVDIVFAGMAEPFLNKDCIKMIDHAFYKGHKISVYTTGDGMSIEDAHNCKNYTYHHFCLHLPDADGLMKLKVTPHYLEVIKILMPLQNNLLCIGKLHPEVEKVSGAFPTSGEDGLFSRGGTLQKYFKGRKSGKIWCSACTDDLNHNVILPNGDMLLCCMDYNQKHVIGNLNEMTYADCFHSEEYKRIKRGLDGDESIDILCRNCEVSEKVIPK